MTEDEARDWLNTTLHVSRETWGQLEQYIAMLFDEMPRQNLIAESTRDHIWARHIVDSAQLIPLAREAHDGVWMDLGSGAGLPGIIIAIMTDWPVLLVESRRRRVEFLQCVVDNLGLKNATVALSRLETLPHSSPAAVISARAFAPLPRLLEKAEPFADKDSIWLLPKGKNWQSEIEAVRPHWHGLFHVEQSVTDPDSAIILARLVQKRGRR